MTGAPFDWLRVLDAPPVLGQGISHAELVEALGRNDVPVSGRHALLTNFPNPFNPTTTIRYSTLRSDIINITVFDELGQPVRVLVNERRTPGVYDVLFDANGLASGFYICRLTAGKNMLASKLLLIK